MAANMQAAEVFLEHMQQQVAKLNQLLASQGGNWAIRGVIDIFQQIYALSADTKLVSKIMEIVLLPHLFQFAQQHDYKVVLSPEQNYYPDLSFIDNQNCKFALDIKSAYRVDEEKVSTMTLGTFTGYFRERNSKKNITFPYSEYSGHFVLGIIYTRNDIPANHSRTYQLSELSSLPAVIRDIHLFVQPKYRIASDKPGSGNTKNIGAINNIEDLINGRGPFADLGEEVFDDYWMHYMTSDMARKKNLERPPYSDLRSYQQYKQGGATG